jgi:glycosyltransferase involved in cell wall biosynthesis
MMKIAIVVPRYGPDIGGGAETLARGLAKEASRRGWVVEVWTTCARSHYTWKNAYPAGREESRGVVVLRFPIDQWDADRHTRLDTRLARQGHIPVAEQYAWLESGAHATSLYRHMIEHSSEFDMVLALPCATPLVHYAAWAAPGRVVVWPCLHDEPYAYTEPNRLLLESAWGTVFLSPEERDLVRQLRIRPRHQEVVGGGVAPISLVEDSRLLEKSPVDLLYVGRLEPGKGLDRLYDYVRRYCDAGGDIRLVVLGRGPLKPPRHPAFRYLGFVSEARKAQAHASALVLCQPSVNESFSISMMESWLAARPVLVHGECAVTAGHVRRSKGGLWFRTYEEFVGGVEWFRSNPILAARMGGNGRRYVLDNYSWETVVARFERAIRCWEREDG